MNPSSPVERLLSHLDGVKETASGQFVAKCPAHDDKTPSLAVRDLGDRVLVHCFAGCAAGEIMESVDLTLADLFETPVSHHGPTRNRWDARALLKTSLDESVLVLIAANQVTRGEPLDGDDHRRLCEAVKRIAGIVEVVA